MIPCLYVELHLLVKPEYFFYIYREVNIFFSNSMFEEMQLFSTISKR